MLAIDSEHEEYCKIENPVNTENPISSQSFINRTLFVDFRLRKRSRGGGLAIEPS
jgi:hypothetical protein